ncbi:MAG TPA: phospholipid carrier-dependent glycosyltransferase [Friedmanniella sp.]
MTAVFAAALAARVAIVEAGGGLLGMGNYDDGVYFSASVALLHGRLPYRDFLFLQPPGILVVLAPFAALGPWVGDAHAFVAARLGFLLLGAVNAALVALALRRFGGLAALAGGTSYALALASAHTERSTLLEPVGSFGTLVAVAVLLRPGAQGSAPPSRREQALLLVAGLALGLGVMTKVFFAVAALVVVVAAGRRAVPLLVGCVVVGLAVGSFALAAPGAAWQQVVLDQFGRPRLTRSPIHRLTSILQVARVPHVPPAAVLGLALAAVLACCLLAVRVRGGRLPVVLLLASFPVLIAAPSYFRHYAALTATPLSLVVGIGVAEAVRRLAPEARQPAVPVAVLAVALVSLSSWWHAGVGSFVSPPLPRVLLEQVRSVPGCVTADDPSVLVFAGTLSRTLDQGCPFWPDTTGWLYDADAPPASDPRLPPERNPAWQRHAFAYLTSGDATVLVRRRDGLSAETRARIGTTTSWRQGHLVLRRFAD